MTTTTRRKTSTRRTTATTTKSAKKRRPWSPADVRTLKGYARLKRSAKSIARRLHRTEGATRQKAFAIGLSLETRKAA